MSRERVMVTPRQASHLSGIDPDTGRPVLSRKDIVDAVATGDLYGIRLGLFSGSLLIHRDDLAEYVALRAGVGGAR